MLIKATLLTELPEKKRREGEEKGKKRKDKKDLKCACVMLTLSRASLGKSTVYGRWGLRHPNFVLRRRMAKKLRTKLRNELLFALVKSFWGVHIQVLVENFTQRCAVSLSANCRRSHMAAEAALAYLDFLGENEPLDSDGLSSGDDGSDISLGNDDGPDMSGSEGESDANSDDGEVLDDGDDDQVVFLGGARGGRGARGRGGRGVHRGRGERGRRVGRI